MGSSVAWFVVAAYLTALDAIATDLFGIPKISILAGMNPQGYSFSEEFNSLVILHCGNFGVILLHGAWFENGGRYAFDILEKMIQVTMMRGAQSGKIQNCMFKCRTVFYIFNLYSSSVFYDIIELL